jgi:AbrB family looped-hinge helix DNA binding protein
MDATVVLGRQGRVVIPAEVRAALGLSAGDKLNLHVSGRSLVLMSRETAVSELRRLAAGVASGRSLVDELLEERRQAAEAAE